MCSVADVKCALYTVRWTLYPVTLSWYFWGSNARQNAFLSCAFTVWNIHFAKPCCCALLSESCRCTGRREKLFFIFDVSGNYVFTWLTHPLDVACVLWARTNIEVILCERFFGYAELFEKYIFFELKFAQKCSSQRRKFSTICENWQGSDFDATGISEGLWCVLKLKCGVSHHQYG